MTKADEYLTDLAARESQPAPKRKGYTISQWIERQQNRVAEGKEPEVVDNGQLDCLLGIFYK